VRPFTPIVLIIVFGVASAIHIEKTKQKIQLANQHDCVPTK
jgi:presenilin-like A22 family membrane protease